MKRPVGAGLFEEKTKNAIMVNRLVNYGIIPFFQTELGQCLCLIKLRQE